MKVVSVTCLDAYSGNSLLRGCLDQGGVYIIFWCLTLLGCIVI